MVDNGGRLDVATWGEFHGYACKQNGVSGAVVDSATRDGPEIRTSGFPTFVRGLAPVSSKWDLKTASINGPVMLGHVEVNPGDYYFRRRDRGRGHSRIQESHGAGEGQRNPEV